MATVLPTTVPKPFVFVLMPFEERFKDTYIYGIKGAADDVGAYAERLDDQIFTDGMLDRIFNQISKADVIVADMTGRNANVFYEVGYAHALGKIVLLVTQNAHDIPFDLKHRQHIVYSGQIEKLRKELGAKLKWAIDQSRQGVLSTRGQLSLRVFNSIIPEGIENFDVPEVLATARQVHFNLPIFVRNEASSGLLSISHAYLFTDDARGIVPRVDFEYSTSTVLSIGTPILMPGAAPEPLEPFDSHPEDSPDGLSTQFRLPLTFSVIPPRAVEHQILKMMIVDVESTSLATARCRLRFHSETKFYDFKFNLRIKLEPEPPEDSANG